MTLPEKLRAVVERIPLLLTMLITLWCVWTGGVALAVLAGVQGGWAAAVGMLMVPAWLALLYLAVGREEKVK